MTFLSYSFIGTGITQKYITGDTQCSAKINVLSFLFDRRWRGQRYFLIVCENNVIWLFKQYWGSFPSFSSRMADSNLEKMKSEKRHYQRKARPRGSARAAYVRSVRE